MKNETKKPITVLSLFDGCSITRLALSNLDIPCTYYASEVDKQAMKVSAANFPDIMQLGDVRSVKGSELPPITLMTFGSPCQSLSSARIGRTGLDSEDSGLFYEALRILKEVKPKYFLMENVKSMAASERDKISKELGVEPIYINSNLLTAQNRSRLYWTDIPNITQPEDAGIKLQDILNPHSFADREKSCAVMCNSNSYTRKGLERYLNKSFGQFAFESKSTTELSKEDKLTMFDFITDEGKIKENYDMFFRKLEISELEKLQGMPAGFVGDHVQPTVAHKIIGNAFSEPIIRHILKFANLD